VVDPEKFEPGMALQLARFQEALAEDMPRRGWKVGINVPEVLRRLELPHPGVGWLNGARILTSGAVVEAPPGSRLHVEPEIALRVSQRVPVGCSHEVARNCVSTLYPALEIVDYAKPGSGLTDVVGHSMFHEAAVLGPASALRLAQGLGSRWPRLRAGDNVADSPRDDLVPADLGQLVAFVASFLSAFGHALEPGDLLLSGSYTAKALSISPGDEALAEFGPLGAVSVRVSA
jgi:2-keto-4-pentenoate hydratase